MTKQLRIAIASDHAGVALKAAVKDALGSMVKAVADLGAHDPTQRVDYVDYVRQMVTLLQKGDAQLGIAICGSGIGVSIAANRHRGIHAAVCHDGLSARLSRQHNNANVLCLGARLIGVETALDCVRQFLTTPFESGTERYVQRIQKLDEIM